MTAEKTRDEISVQIGDLTYHATFSVDGDLVTVRTAYSLKAASLDGRPADTVARELLRELVLNWQAAKVR